LRRYNLASIGITFSAICYWWTFVNVIVGDLNVEPRYDGRGLHSSTSQLNLSRFCHKIYPKHPLTSPDTP